MKILVTGGAGFIGSNFVHYWMNHHPDDDVVVLDALTYSGCEENLATVRTNPHFLFIKGDIRDMRAVEAAMRNVDTVVHFAAESHVDRSIKDPSIFVTTNVIGTQ